MCKGKLILALSELSFMRTGIDKQVGVQEERRFQQRIPEEVVERVQPNLSQPEHLDSVALRW